jgi:hypothetical protein
VAFGLKKVQKGLADVGNGESGLAHGGVFAQSATPHYKFGHSPKSRAKAQALNALKLGTDPLKKRHVPRDRVRLPL